MATWRKLAYDDEVVKESDYSAKGVLIAGSGAGTAVALSIGSDGQVLTADSGETSGMKWATISGTGDFKADGTVAMTGDLDFNENNAVDMALHQVADSTALNALTGTVAKIAFQASDTSVYICTSVT